MRNQYLTFLLCFCFSLLSMNLTAQSTTASCNKNQGSCSKSCSNTGKASCSQTSYNFSVSISESDNNSNFMLDYSTHHTSKVEAFLIRKLGNDYSESVTGTKNWNDEFSVISENGYATINYNGTDTNTKSDAEKLFNDIIAVVKSEKE